ncbi:MAG: NAD-dependent epimerase/dehydratase family protein, partial [Conexivisphaerales archaeon]
MSKTLLITGASGFVGRHLKKYMEEKGYSVLGLDINGKAEINGDITDSSFVFETLAKEEFDYVIHLAALTNIKQTTEDPYSTYKVNSFGTLNLLELAYKKQVSMFIYASSANVYGKPLELPVTEQTPFNPRLPYDYSKVISEKMVRSYQLHKGLRAAITRTWLLFGEGEPETRAVPRFVRSCFKNDKIPLYNSGRDVTDPTYVLNYCRAVELIMQSEKAV